MPRHDRRVQRKEPPAACPFCEERIPRAKPLPQEIGPDVCNMGRCTCGAIFILDETGKQGGQCLLHALSQICGGDLDRGMALESGVDYELLDVSYNPRTHSLAKQTRRRYGQPKLWFIRLLKPAVR